MRKIQLTVAELGEPGKASILAPMPDALPLQTGKGITDYLCGSCRTVLFASMPPKPFDRFVGEGGAPVYVRCPCGAHNMLPRSDIRW